MPWISDKDLKRAQEWLGDPTVTVSVGPEGVGPEGVKPVTPPTSSPSSAMSQELSEEKLREHLSVKPKHWHAFKSLTQDEVYRAVEDLLATRAALLSLQRKNEELVRAQGWQLIETAPKTGYIIGAWQDGKWVSAQIWWDDNVEVWVHATGDDYVRPTHWMPLPDVACREALRSISEEKP